MERLYNREYCRDDQWAQDTKVPLLLALGGSKRLSGKSVPGLYGGFGMGQKGPKVLTGNPEKELCV
jgi:hypothetical protein